MAVADVLLLLVSLEFILNVTSTEEPINENMLIIDTSNSRLKENHIQSPPQVAGTVIITITYNFSPRYNHLDIS